MSVPSHMRAVVVEAFGGPEVLTPVDRPMPRPRLGHVLIEQAAIGINFVDLNHRAGTPYPMTLPFVPGIEAIGHVIALGDGVDPGWEGATVGYAGPMPGAYASHTVIAADDLVRIPDDLPAERAASVLMQGMTAWYLSHLVTECGPSDRVLVLAAATGVGRHLARWLTAKSATVIGTSRRAAGVARMREDGIAHALLVEHADDLTDLVAGELGTRNGVHVAFDSLGGPFCRPALGTLAAKGHYISYGLAAGPSPDLSVAALSGFFDTDLAGSLRMQWASLGDYLDTPELRQQAADAVFKALAEGILLQPPTETFPLDQAAAAHAWLDTHDGKALLTP
ncbi:alcohol dehydrogenase catalytic domain-containing protein [Pontivivens ytuae]|uniref:Zinc-binding dehydrogenase n=1 Tax=Pontivivens ytuae TaxID=2789856 RepID=A0A7S9QEI9_9RHOB|nr:zinc-binding dehydrogenase [Pontivivens ytuae]QPH56048.1 zinc-binding dehydrogenase [Pontivivens ytuae]